MPPDMIVLVGHKSLGPHLPLHYYFAHIKSEEEGKEQSAANTSIRCAVKRNCTFTKNKKNKIPV